MSVVVCFLSCSAFPKGIVSIPFLFFTVACTYLIAFRQRQLQIHGPEKYCSHLDEMSHSFIPKCPVTSKSMLVQVMAWRKVSDKLQTSIALSFCSTWHHLALTWLWEDRFATFLLISGEKLLIYWHIIVYKVPIMNPCTEAKWRAFAFVNQAVNPLRLNVITFGQM